MNKKGLQVFNDALNSRLSSVHPKATSFDIYYVDVKKWYDINGLEISDKSMRARFEAAKKSGVLRPKGDSRVYFWVNKFDAVAAINCSVAIKTSAQSSAKANLGRVVEDSLNQYRATHDVHTGLRNRTAFDQALLKVLGAKEVDGIDSEVNAEAGVLADAASTVVLASLDIDHFKTINDRFGHGYGDVVLAAFSQRLEKVKDEILAESASGYAVQVFRLGGEEFQILISGSVTEREGVVFAERFAAGVRDELLPSQSEYRSLAKADFFDGSPLPHDSDRRVTVSIGVAASTMAGGESLDAAKKLKRHADLGLNSAKISGRNRVRNFSDILETGGGEFIRWIRLMA